MARAPGGARPTVLSILAKSKTSLEQWRAFALVGLLAQHAGFALGQVYAEGALPRQDESRRSAWSLTPTLSIGETYTDNVFLAPEGAQVGDWVTQIIPGITVATAGPRLRFDATLAPEFINYARTQSKDGVFHHGKAYGNLEISEKLFFLDAGAKVDQYDISLIGALTTSNVNVTSNRATAATTYVSPYLLHDFGSVARAEARVTYSRWASNENAQTLPDNDARNALFRLTSGPAYKSLTWRTVYSGELIKYVTHQETTSEQFNADVKWLITPTVGLLALAGYERYDTGIAFDAIQAPRWSVGFEWTPSPRTLLSATAGERLEDRAYTFEFRHRTRLTSWSASYGEDVTTMRTQFFVPVTGSTAGTLDQIFRSQYPDPVERQKAVQEFIARTGLPPSLSGPVNFFSDELFLQKLWRTSIGLLGLRNSLIASGFWIYRQALTVGGGPAVVSGDFGLSDIIRMRGGSLAWSWRITETSTWNLEAGYARNDFVDIDQVETFTVLRASLTRTLRPRLSASLSYRRQRLDSSLVTTNYTENAATATLRMTF